MSHTPGPWTVGPLQVQRRGKWLTRFRPISGGGLAIASVWAGDADREPIIPLEHEANAVLMAAAPDLLAALRKCLPYVESIAIEQDHPAQEACDIAAAAIEKATQP